MEVVHMGRTKYPETAGTNDGKAKRRRTKRQEASPPTPSQKRLFDWELQETDDVLLVGYKASTHGLGQLSVVQYSRWSDEEWVFLFGTCTIGRVFGTAEQAMQEAEARFLFSFNNTLLWLTERGIYNGDN